MLRNAKLVTLSFFMLGHTAAQAAPNIVFIMVDDLGYGDLAAYGATDVRTPHIDSIAARGVRLTGYYANSSVCSPTRAALMTVPETERVCDRVDRQVAPWLVVSEPAERARLRPVSRSP
jgi:hypothetical protein